MNGSWPKFAPVSLLILVATMAVSSAGPPDDESELFRDPERVYRERLLDADTQKVLNLVPRNVTNVYAPPADWQTLRFDTIELKLPLGTNWSVFTTNDIPNWILLSAFNEETNRFLLSQLGPYPEPDIPYPPVSFAEMHQTISTVPEDLTAAVTMEQKRDVVTRLLTKAVTQSKYVREWVFVQTPTLKAMIRRSPAGRHGFGSVHLSVWNETGTVYCYIMAVRETSPEMGQQILGGVRFHGNAVSADRVRSDIARLRSEHSKPGS